MPSGPEKWTRFCAAALRDDLRVLSRNLGLAPRKYLQHRCRGHSLGHHLRARTNRPNVSGASKHGVVIGVGIWNCLSAGMVSSVGGICLGLEYSKHIFNP